MTEQRNQLAALFAACWKDGALKQRFMSDPKSVLTEYACRSLMQRGHPFVIGHPCAERPGPNCLDAWFFEETDNP